MKKNQILVEAKNGAFKIVNTKLFNGLYQVNVYKSGTIYKVLKSGSMAGNQNNLKQAAKIAGII